MRPAILLLGVANLALAGIVAWELATDATPDAPPLAVVAPGLELAAGTIADEASNERAMATILARPVFSPTRRPPAETVAPTPAPERGPAALPRLTAVLVGPFGGRAIFAATDGGKPLVVEAGDRVGEFRVQSIETGQVTLIGPEGVRQLRPRFASAEPADVAAPKGAGPLMPPGFPPSFVRPMPPSGSRP